MTPLRQVVRIIAMVALRELLVFRRNPVRLLVTLVQPIAFLFILGTGLDVAHQTVGGLDYRTYVYPGIVTMAVVMPSFFVAGSIVYDREFGFLREMLVAPVPRLAIVVGKCVGGALVAMLHAAVVIVLAPIVDVPWTTTMVLACAPLVDVPWSFALAAGLLGLAAFLGFCLTAAGVVLATFARQFQSYMSGVNLVALPMILASGALFPLTGLPDWLGVVTRLNPLSYAADPMRRIVFPLLDFSTPVMQNTYIAPSEMRVTWGDWIVPAWLELGLLAALAAILVGVAARRLDRHG